MCFPPIALWQNMMLLQLPKEGGFFIILGIFQFSTSHTKGLVLYQHLGWEKIGDILPSKELENCTQQWWCFLSFLPGGHYSHESWVHIRAAAVPSCSAENKTCWLHRGRIGMMGTIFTDVNDYPPEVQHSPLQNGWLEDYFPIGKVPFQELCSTSGV